MKRGIEAFALSLILCFGLVVPAAAEEGAMITQVAPFQYDAAFGFSEGFGRVRIDGEGWGYIDTAGNLITPCQYEQAVRFHNGLASVMDKSYNCGAIDAKGREVIPCQYRGVSNYSEGFIPVENDDGLWGILDGEGQEVLPCVLDYASVDAFHEGLAIVVKDGKKGAIDVTGKEVIPCNLDYISVGYFSEGRARVLRGGKWGFIDKTGQEVIPCQWDGEAQAEFNYIEAPFSNGLARVRDGESGLWGYIDKAGSLVIPCKYGWAYTFYEGLAAVRDAKSGLWGFIDTTGKEIVPCRYFCTRNFSDGLAWVWTAETPTGGGMKYGIVDNKGNEIVPCVLEYKGVTDFSKGSALVSALVGEPNEWGGPTKWGVISLSGYKPTFTAYASTQTIFVDGRAVEFQAYALKDANGNDTNYIKLRDVASVLDGTSAQFAVSWDGAVNIETGKAYTSNGSEMSTPFSGDRVCEFLTAVTNINGTATSLDAIVLKDDQGGAFTYYKLRDLGDTIGFTVDWNAEKGIIIETE